MKKMYIIKSSYKDIYKNLALENYLFEFSEKENCAILLLWENISTVVIGKHQNPYIECNLEYMKNNKIKLSRRTTGGGAVYHTLGNINFSFITPINFKALTEDIVQNSLEKCGIKTQKTGRNDLTINGKKFSGNAYYKSKKTYLHHGTIMINMPFEKISNILTPNKSKLIKNSVKSVSSRVINLTEIKKDINKEEIFKEIEKEFINKFSKNFELENKKIVINNDEFQTLYKKFKSKKWIFGKYKDFKTIDKIETKYGLIEILKNKKMETIISTDIVDEDILLNLEKVQNNKEYILKFLKKIK